MDQRGPVDVPEPTRPFPGPNAQSQNPLANYQFSPEEKRVLQECNTESFFQRCVPIGTTMGLGAYYGVRSGHLKPNPRWGAGPKVALAVTIGYFIGKFSYQQKCAEKFMKLPNSQVGELLRQRRRGNFKESLEPGFGPSMALAPFSSGISSSDTYTDVGPGNSLDLDTDRPNQPGLDDYRPADGQIYDEEMPPQQKNSTSYEELRKQNRGEYLNKRTTGNYRGGLPDAADLSPVPNVTRQQLRTDENRSSGGRTKINQYGDTME